MIFLANKKSSKISNAGFTLIELMIVVAVIAILSAIAYPSYQDYVRKSRRAQAKADLVEYMQLAERYYTVQNTYVGFALPSNGNQSPRETGSVAHYAIAAPTQTATTYTLSATANTAQAKDTCGNLGLSNTGIKTNSKSTLSNCW